ncbi:hypothetical protein FACS189472_14230 [Alphaproteobacteria bacterium]|nr:hypothetical protein FACS189472_14230 [Alphaproteobacteria bacterium]
MSKSWEDLVGVGFWELFRLKGLNSSENVLIVLKKKVLELRNHVRTKGENERQ